MNKKLITAAVLAGLAGIASANVNVNPEGTGELLLFPYYTTANGNTTDIVIVNTTNQTKAVKVRYSEGGNSWEVMDFNLYLSPYDVWAGGVSMRQDGTAPIIYTGDSSCTVPTILNYADAHADAKQLKKQTFKAQNITDKNIIAAQIDPATRIKEGYVEVIEMGIVVDSDPADNIDLAKDIEHKDGVPNNCDNVVRAWNGTSSTNPTESVWYQNSLFDIQAPTGGLFGIGQIINVKDAAARMYDAVALQNVYIYGAPSDAANPSQYGLHSAPGTIYPDLSGNYVKDTKAGTVLNVNTGGGQDFVRANVHGAGGVILTPEFDKTTGTPPQDGAGYATIRAITAALSVSTVQNIFNAETGNAAMSDWVITFPTKHEFVSVDTVTADGGLGHTGYVTPGSPLVPLAPFTVGHNVPIALSMWNSEEKAALTDINFSPSGINVLPFETNVLSFSDKSILKSNYGAKVDKQDDFLAGWAKLKFDTDKYQLCDDIGNVECVTGLPVLGFGTTQLYNGNKSYSTLYNHRYDHIISN